VLGVGGKRAGRGWGHMGRGGAYADARGWWGGGGEGEKGGSGVWKKRLSAPWKQPQRWRNKFERLMGARAMQLLCCMTICNAVGVRVKCVQGVLDMHTCLHTVKIMPTLVTLLHYVKSTH
jgi:hypothetical protein